MGTVERVVTGEGSTFVGRLAPTDAYRRQREELRGFVALVSGLVAEPGLAPKEIRARFMGHLEREAAHGLQLRDEQGSVVTTRMLFVSDALPPESDPADLPGVTVSFALDAGARGIDTPSPIDP